MNKFHPTAVDETIIVVFLVVGCIMWIVSTYMFRKKGGENRDE